MGGSDPKYLDLQKEETVKYNIRIENSLLNKYKELSNLTGKSTARLIKEVLREYFKNRNVYNTYLENVELFYMKIPHNIILKDFLTSRLNDPYFFRSNGKQEDYEPFINAIIQDELDGITNYSNGAINNIWELKLYKVFRVPNNLDQWNEQTSTYSSYYKNGTDYINTGLELLIIPELAEFTNNYLDCLYCFYFELNREGTNNNLMVTLLNVQEALDLIAKSNNIYLELLANNIYTLLNDATKPEDIEEIAKAYNSNNIVTSEFIQKEKIEPIKLLETNKREVTVNYHDKQLLNKVERLEKENEELKNRIETIEEETKKQTEEAIKEVLKKYL